MADGYGLTNDSSDIENNSRLFESIDNTSSPVTDFTQFTEYHVAKWLNYYTPWMAFITALLGNGASVVTVVHMGTLSSVAVFVSYLGITDTLFIVFSFMYTQFTRYKLSLGNAGCKMLIFFMNYAKLLANWTVVLMTIERFVAVYFPLKITRIFNFKKSVFTLILTAGGLIVPAGFSLWMYTEIQYDEASWECAITPELESVGAVMSWVDLAVLSLVPSLLLIFLNGGIIVKLNKSAKVRQHVINADLLRNRANNSGRQVRSPLANQHRTLSVMLVTVSVTFILLQLPITLFFIIDKYQTPPTDGRPLAVYYLVREIIFTLSEFNHAINFLLYFLSGRKFREKFLDLVGCSKFVRRIRIRETRDCNDLSSREFSHLDTQLTKLNCQGTTSQEITVNS